ncbi:MAG: hypothetical protein ABIR66_10275 [Saprospiraceae bacterium]
MSLWHCETNSKDVVIECAAGPNQAILIRKGCESYVFQLTQVSVLTQPDWKDIFTKKSYQNVLSVLNYCDDTPESKTLQSLKTGDKVTMQLIVSQDRCLNQCFAFEDAPGKSYKASEINICLQ